MTSKNKKPEENCLVFELLQVKKQIDFAITMIRQGRAKELSPAELENFAEQFGSDAFVIIGDYVIKRRKSFWKIDI